MSKTYSFQGILFDLDGTMVDSIAAVDRAWRRWSQEFNMDPEEVVPRIHGRRAMDSIRELAPHLDPQIAFARIEHFESSDVDGVVPLPGLHEFLERIRSVPWGIVTSGSRAIALPRLKAGGISLPDVFVTAEDIVFGKPDPEPFLTGATRLGISPREILAFEDTVAGVRSARAAGMAVIGLTPEAGHEADSMVGDYADLTVATRSNGWEITIP